MAVLDKFDPEIYNALNLEAERQRKTINLIASENYTSKAVLETQGSFLTNKYAEGYPGKRYYGGCENADTIEELARNRAKELFKADHANVQPHSGAQANMAAYMSVLTTGDTVVGMTLAHGGHLTHGANFNFSGKLYNFVFYGVSEKDERIDYAEVERIVKDCNPKLIVAGASAYPRIIDFERLRFIADQVGAKLMVDMAHIAGLVAAGLHPSPVPYADIVTSTAHKTLRGPRSGFILCKAELAKAVDASVFPRVQGGPLMHVIAGKAVAFREAMTPEFVQYQKTVIDNASVLASELQKGGLRIVSGGTDNHLVLADLTQTDSTGKQAEEALGKANIVINRNTIPFETRSPRITSGIRLGTAATASRGFGETETKKVAEMILRVLHNIDSEELAQQVKQEVIEMCAGYPVPGIDI